LGWGPGAPPRGVDLYVGGVEHAVLHLLYSRFWHKVLYDLGHVSTAEPFQRLFNQGMIGAYAYTDERGVYVPAGSIDEHDGELSYEGRPVTRRYGKMGKSLKNGVTPDEIYEAFGADTLRVYEMAMGPLDMGRPWSSTDIVGAHRLLQRAWRAIVDEDTGELRIAADEVETDVESRKVLHRAIAGVGDDYAALRFNTAVAKLTELVNHVTKTGTATREVAETMTKLLAPLAPHIAEELWTRLGHEPSVGWEPFPVADPALLVDDTTTLVVQVNGKVRDRLDVPVSITAEDAEAAALASDKIQELLAGGQPRKVITRPPGLVNVVI
jgi:leucyl-tRNA synthetase